MAEPPPKRPTTIPAGPLRTAAEVLRGQMRPASATIASDENPTVLSTGSAMPPIADQPPIASSRLETRIAFQGPALPIHPPPTSSEIAATATALGGPGKSASEGATRGMEGGGQSPSPSLPPSQSGLPPSTPPHVLSPEIVRILIEVAVGGISSATMAGPIAKVAWDTLLADEPRWARGTLELLAAIMIEGIGLTFPLWKKRMTSLAQGSLRYDALRWWLPTSIFLFFAYIVGPDIYKRASAPPSAQDIAAAVVSLVKPPTTPPPTAQDIAAALIPAIKAEIGSLKMALPTPQSNPVRPSVEPFPPYVNPIHDEATKWRLASNITHSMKQDGLKCSATIRRYQLQYAEDYAADLKLILDAVGWPYSEVFASSTVPRGISLRVVQEGQNQKSVPCMNLLYQRLQNDVRTKAGGTLQVETQSLASSEAPDYLKQCPGPCVEISIGNEGQ